MDLPLFQRLTSPAGKAALVQAALLDPTEASALACLGTLRKSHSDDIARAALEVALLRRRARAKFPDADRLYFDRESLEQSSGAAVAAHRARRYASYGRVADLCCGAGGDTLELARVALVVAADADPLRLAMAEANAAARGLAGRCEFRLIDLEAADPPEAAAFFFDPDRRPGGRRAISLAAYRPPMARLKDWLQRTPAAGVKVAPGVPWAEIAALPAEAEFISVGGELKECALWFGPLRSAGRRATALPSGDSIAAEQPAESPGISEVRRFVYDPDPAVVRSGLVTDLAARMEALQIDPSIAFLTADSLTRTPLAAAYEVEESVPFNAKPLRDLLRRMGVGRVTVVKRGSPVDPPELTRRLKLSGAGHRDLILTRVGGRPFALVARRLGKNPPTDSDMGAAASDIG